MPADPDAPVETSDPRFVAQSGLRLAVVRYDDSPDRCTVSPRDVDEDDLLTHWLSIDAALLVPVESMR